MNFIWGGDASHNKQGEEAHMRYVAEDPRAHLEYFSAMFGTGLIDAVDQRVCFETPRGETIEILSGAECAELMPGSLGLQPGMTGRGVGFGYSVESLERCRWSLRDGGGPRVEQNGGLIVSASHGCGMAIEFPRSKGDPHTAWLFRPSGD